MASDASFLQAILQEPDPSDLRLVYADWLEDQGDERAELIRLMEMMKPMAVYSDAFWELRPRRNELLSSTDEPWLGQMGYRSYPPMAYDFPDTWPLRFRVMEELIHYWHPPVTAEDGCTEEELIATEERLQLKLPEPLKEWYRWSGER